MANGRMITNSICGDKRINELESDTSRLAFTWLITFADREGRTHGDPAMVRSMLFPRRQDVTIEAMETMIAEWYEIGLIVWYEADGDLWIWFPNFEKNQPGLRKEKEAPSKIPAHDEEGAELVRTKGGVSTPQVPVKRKEEKRKENNTRRPAAPPSPPNNDQYQIAMALSKVTGLDFEKNRARLFKEAKTYTMVDLPQIQRDYSPGGLWYLHDWRGRKGEKPKLEQVRETWGNLKPLQVSKPADTFQPTEVY